MLRTTFTPRHLTGLQLWLDFSDSATVTLDGNGLISQINDKSGNGYNGTQTTAANRPGTSTLNGLTVADWGTASNQKRLIYAAGANTSNWRETILVGVWDAGGSTFPDFCGVFTGSAVSGTESGAGLVGNSGGATWFTGSWHTSRRLNGTDTNTAFDTIKSPFVIQFWRNADVGVNGYCVGMDRQFGSRAWRGRIAEVVSYSRELNDDERVLIRRRMASKWGITL